MKSTKRGFSLVEILIASTILVVCMIPVISLSQRVLVETESGQEDLLARHLVIDMCERFKTVPIAEIKTAAANPAALTRDELLIPLAWRGGSSKESRLAGDVLHLARSIQIQENVGGEQGLHKVTFTVTWTTRKRNNRSVGLTRIIHDH